MQDAVGLAGNPNGGLHHWRFGTHSLLMDSLTACAFLTGALISTFGGRERWAITALHNAYGWDWTLEDLKNTSSRLVLMERAYALREGHVPTRDDILPERFFTEAQASLPIRSRPLAERSPSAGRARSRFRSNRRRGARARRPGTENQRAVRAVASFARR